MWYCDLGRTELIVKMGRTEAALGRDEAQEARASMPG